MSAQQLGSLLNLAPCLQGPFSWPLHLPHPDIFHLGTHIRCLVSAPHLHSRSLVPQTHSLLTQDSVGTQAQWPLSTIQYLLITLYSKGPDALCLCLYLNAHMCRYACLFASVHVCEWVYLHVWVSIYMHVYVNLYNGSISTMLSILHTTSLIFEVDNRCRGIILFGLYIFPNTPLR